MDWEPINSWTSTLYTIIYAMEFARADEFSNKEELHSAILSGARWVEPVCTFASPLMAERFGNSKVKFRRDPSTNFRANAQNVVKMLLQDLVVIFDEMMTQALVQLSFTAGDHPQSKVEKLYTVVDQEFVWARDACLELIAVRNVLCHSGGKWNERTISIVKGFVVPPPKPGERLQIGTPMLFRYRKAVRTFLNEVKKSYAGQLSCCQCSILPRSSVAFTPPAAWPSDRRSSRGFPPVWQ